MIVDASSGAPRYVVVDAGGLFTWRRSLLPVSLVRFDRSSGLLRVALDKDIAERYPAFDRREFEAMADEAVRLYEERLLDFFPKDDAVSRVPPIAEGEPPEWLVKSVWLTARPGRIDPFADEAARAESEFAPPGDDRERNADRIVARGDAEQIVPAKADDAPTPPHGEKLR